jgi:hypothetical protein
MYCREFKKEFLLKHAPGSTCYNVKADFVLKKSPDALMTKALLLFNGLGGKKDGISKGTQDHTISFELLQRK